MKPLILLDVDGVLNPFHRPEPQWQPHRLATNLGTYSVLLNPGHGPELLGLAERCGAELVWATMWEHEANRLISPLLGLPQLPVVEMTEKNGYGGGPFWVHTKTPPVVKFAAGRPFVWFDDELGRHDTRWLKDHPDVAGFRLIHVEGMRGLTDKHVQQAERWFTELGAAPC